MSALKPRSTPPSAIDVRINSAAPIKSTTASAISTSTSAERVRPSRRSWPERLPALLMTLFKSTRALASAGISPNSTPVPSDTATANVTTRQSMPTDAPASNRRGRPAVSIASSARIATRPMPTPSAPPTAANNMDSVNSCCTMRRRPAPSAERMAISRRRREARINSKPATLTQAMSSTNATAPSSTHNVRPVSPTSASRSVTAVKLSPA